MPAPTDMRIALNQQGIWMVQDRTTGFMAALDPDGSVFVRNGDTPDEPTLQIMRWVLAHCAACDDCIKAGRSPYEA